MEVDGLITIAGYIVIGCGIVIALAFLYVYDWKKGDD